MAWKTNVLVVANVTAGSPELLQALQQRAARGPTAFTLIVPPRGPGHAAREQAAAQLESALAAARGRELEIDGAVGHPDPVVAVTEALDPRRDDEVIVSTLPSGLSRWLQIDLPHRIAKATGLPVQHVLSREPPPAPAVVHPSPPPRRGVLAPLTPLTWGRRPGEEDGARHRPARRPPVSG